MKTFPYNGIEEEEPWRLFLIIVYKVKNDLPPDTCYVQVNRTGRFFPQNSIELV